MSLYSNLSHCQLIDPSGTNLPYWRSFLFRDVIFSRLIIHNNNNNNNDNNNNELYQSLMSYAQAQCLTDRGDWRENIEEKVSSNASAKLTPLVDSLAKSGFPLSICISVFLHTNLDFLHTNEGLPAY